MKEGTALALVGSVLFALIRIEYVALGFSLFACILAIVAYVGQRQIWAHLGEDQAEDTEIIEHFDSDNAAPDDT